MTDILPPAGWPNVRQLETNEFATGGSNGNMNEQAKSLAARSELLKQYAALPYESKTGGYALNERVQLATGDIVRSTIPSNVNNPNENMTGWVNVAAWSSIKGKPELYTKTEADTLFIESTQIGQPNGVAGLDPLGKLDSAQFPLATDTTPGIAKINNTLTSTATDAALTAAQGKVLSDSKLDKTSIVATGTAPYYVCRAWVNFNGVPLNGRYLQAGTLVTVTMTAHGMSVGQIVNLSVTSGTGVSGIYTVASVDSANTFTYVAGTSLTTSGNITRNNYIRASGNVLSVTDSGVGMFVVNFAVPMPDTNCAVTVSSKRDTASWYGASVLDAGLTVNSVAIGVYAGDNFADSSFVSVAVFR